jgi:predicted TIM-barrel fold metal-dependent hydrolase
MSKYGYPIIDCDGHVMEGFDFYEPYVEDEFKEPVRRIVAQIGSSARGLSRMVIGDAAHRGARPLGAGEVYEEVYRHVGSRHPETLPGAEKEPRDRLQDMDRESVDVAVCFPTSATSLVAITDPEIEAAMVRAYNRWIAEYCSSNPARLKAVCVLPQRDLKRGVEELRRMAEAPWCVGFVTFGSLDGHLPHAILADSPYWYPLWEEAQSLDMPVSFHAGTDRPPYAPARTEVGNNAFLLHMSGQPWHIQRTLAAVIGGGVLDNFPRLRVAFLETGCGWVPWWMDRLDMHYELYAAHVPLLQHKPSEHIRGPQCFFSFDPDEITIEATVDLLGENRLMWASDYPHFDCRFPHTVDLVTDRHTLSEDIKAKIMGQNALQFYRRIRSEDL